MKLISLVYNIAFMPLFSVAVSIMKLFNSKLRQREGDWEDIMESMTRFNERSENNNAPRLWFHAASMGEFEQAKPVIENIKRDHPDYIIIVSFFSPSGWVNQRNYEHADVVLYMPIDKRFNAQYFIREINPSVAVFVRYDVWRNHLEVLKKRNVPTLLVCATKPGGKFLTTAPFLRSFTRSNYSYFDKIITVGKEHSDFFRDFGVTSDILTSSDTRFDRIIQNVAKAAQSSILPTSLFSDDELVLVAGSTWSADEEIIIEGIKKIEKENIHRVKLILVPHEPSKSNLNRIKKLLPHSFFLSEIDKFIEDESDKDLKSFVSQNHIIVDSIGKLLMLYGHAGAAYIGGAFGTGVHSVTEPAGYGIPIACGPKHTNSPDASHLVKSGAIRVINDCIDFNKWVIDLIDNDESLAGAGKTAAEYVYSAKGASSVTSSEIIKMLP
jgi:3-deoxy-D-manno-octulosonic-acid transferase